MSDTKIGKMLELRSEPHRRVCAFRPEAAPKPQKGSLFAQDAFDHDKGQESVISGRRLQWIFGIFSSGFFPCSPGFLCNLVRESWFSVPIRALPKSHRKYPKQSKNAPKSLKMGLWGAFFRLSGVFSGHFRRPTQRPFVRLACRGDSCKWRLGSQC